MANFPVDNLSQYGYAPDAAPSTLPHNAFSYARNWRFSQSGFAEVTAGYQEVYTGIITGGTALGNLNTSASFLFTWSLDDLPALIYYDSTARTLVFGEIVSDLFTETTLSTGQHPETVTNEWQGTEAFGVPILNNGKEAPWVYNDDGSTKSVVPLTNWPAGATCEFITSYGAFLVAVGYRDPTSSTVANRGGSRVIAISDVILIPGTVPDWDFDNPDSFAQIFDLSLHSAGPLVSAYEQNEILYVNSTTNVTTLTGGDGGIFTATNTPFPNGVLTKRVTALIPNGQFNIGNRVMYTHDGTSTVTVGEGSFVDTWFNSVDESRIDEVQAVYDPRSKSVWIKTPTGTGVQEMWIYNIENNTLSVLDDHEEINFMLFSADGVPSIPVTWDTFGADAMWDTLERSQWNEFPTNIAEGFLFRNRLLSVGARNVFVHDQGFDFNGRTITATLQRQDLRFINNTYASNQIMQLRPHVGSDTSGAMLTCRVGGSNSVNDTTSWTPTRTFNVDTGQKLDFRKTIKWGAVEFVSDTSGVRLSGYEIDYNTSGGR